MDGRKDKEVLTSVPYIAYDRIWYKVLDWIKNRSEERIALVVKATSETAILQQQLRNKLSLSGYRVKWSKKNG